MNIFGINLTSCKNFVVGPLYADSANSHQGCFSLVHMKNGIYHASCKQTILTPHKLAA